MEKSIRLVESAASMDYRALFWCQRRRSKRLLITIARHISRTADGYLYLLVGLIAYFQEMHDWLRIAMLAFAIERVFYFVIKKRVRRNRPPDAIPGFHSAIRASDQFSFPSGHTSAAFLMSTLLTTEIPWLAIVLYPWAVAVGWSRVMLGVHYPGDTLAGACLGTSVALIIAS